MSRAESRFDLAREDAERERARAQQEIRHYWHEHRVAEDQRLVTPELLVEVSLSVNPEAREQQVASELDARYPEASTDDYARAQLALMEEPPSQRLQSYENILWFSHNRILKARLDELWTRSKLQCEIEIERLRAEYSNEVDLSLQMRAYELAAEQARVDRENADAAAAWAIGLTAAAAVGAAAAAAASDHDSSGSGYTQYTAPSSCPKLEAHDVQGCCSWHAGVDSYASERTGRLMCLDGQESPTCTCF